MCIHFSEFLPARIFSKVYQFLFTVLFSFSNLSIQQARGRGVCLIDFGRAIDVRTFPSTIQFRGSSCTDGFQCREMLNNQPWKWQVLVSHSIAMLFFHCYPMFPSLISWITMVSRQVFTFSCTVNILASLLKVLMLSPLLQGTDYAHVCIYFLWSYV